MAHWQVCDIVIRNMGECFVLAIRFKAIKQDPRIERPQARALEAGDRGRGSDWAYVGDVPGSVFSPFMWYRRLMGFYVNGGRQPTDPFFMAEDRVRPYTYGCASTDLKASLRRVGYDDNRGLHGLRVEGYNASKAANGEELTAAHGGWVMGSQLRYTRFSVTQIAGIARNMVGVDAGDDDPSERAWQIRTPAPVPRAERDALRPASAPAGRGGRGGRGGRARARGRAGAPSPAERDPPLGGNSPRLPAANLATPVGSGSGSRRTDPIALDGATSAPAVGRGELAAVAAARNIAAASRRRRRATTVARIAVATGPLAASVSHAPIQVGSPVEVPPPSPPAARTRSRARHALDFSTA